ncbi:MAG: hypothetical protein A2381_13300 [Bdellovibrionales bacterium RIFOXYB1_FULL_37_110]|nr:MAG: hypothetical protein A2181_02625 [Bdellovibrionales bacterium RIFOXYA1_FULL_38_20]OFZ51678.1 MAG: hypothetical protein A2417_12960 [Bdellovibrionales bacterium RIFOXYC1_FULL_37_79]OFZ60505.1 MAG: hypothetical protein A2381_13300 [Bdellovibrionales bacterium RIFOXYB1_FULL_37_110]OFZ65079.1 MAG: hypothetical protein A2577_09565 [Bdellovibrionales bacterium RIFOXYD1_FULL_36_51]OFZ66917.1 MAG: hypothetical protein A2328_07430 [Bdellovibrionales bacterium RIFOXYB2_FULL_36_6]
MKNNTIISNLLGDENNKRLSSYIASPVLVKNDYVEDADIILLDTTYSGKDFEQIMHKSGPRVLLISHHEFEKVLFDYLCKYHLNHVIGQESLVLDREFQMHLNYKLTNTWPTIPSMLYPDSEIAEITIRDSKLIDESLDCLFNRVIIGPFFDSPIGYLRVLGNELLMNAFFSSQYNNKSRSEKIVLDCDIELSLGVDENFLVLSVKDPFGTLSRNQLIKSLERGFREKTPVHKSGGAGLGLYMTLLSTNQIIINVKPNHYTEIICVIDRSKRIKTFKGRTTSFNLYEGV